MYGGRGDYQTTDFAKTLSYSGFPIKVLRSSARELSDKSILPYAYRPIKMATSIDRLLTFMVKDFLEYTKVSLIYSENERIYFEDFFEAPGSHRTTIVDDVQTLTEDREVDTFL